MKRQQTITIPIPEVPSPIPKLAYTELCRLPDRFDGHVVLRRSPRTDRVCSPKSDHPGYRLLGMKHPPGRG